MACTVLKVSHEEEIRRMELKKSEISYSDVIQGISELIPDLKGYTAKYFDEEGDACTLCEASFKDFLAVSRAMVSQAVTDKARQATLLLKLQLVGPALPKEPSSAVRDTGSIQQDTKEENDGKEGKGEAHDTMVPENIESEVMNTGTSSQGHKKVRPCADVACTYQATWHATHCCHACATGQGHGPRCERLEQAWVLKTSKDLKTLPEINARISVAMLPYSMHPLDKEDIFELSENLDDLKPKSDLDRVSRRELLKRLDEIEASLGSKPRTGC